MPTQPTATIWNGSHGPSAAEEEPARERTDRTEQEPEPRPERVARDEHDDEHRAEAGDEPGQAKRDHRGTEDPEQGDGLRTDAPPTELREEHRAEAQHEHREDQRAVVGVVLVHARCDRQHERPEERDEADEVHCEQGGDPQAGMTGERADARRPAVVVGSVRASGRVGVAFQLPSDHAIASATCSGVSQPGPNARVIWGAKTVESPSTALGDAVGDDLAAGEDHDPVRDAPPRAPRRAWQPSRRRPWRHARAGIP